MGVYPISSSGVKRCFLFDLYFLFLVHILGKCSGRIMWRILLFGSR